MPNIHHNISPAEVLRYLDGVAFPAPRGTLLNHARRVDAPPSVMELLERIPDRAYESAADLGGAIASVE
jgi:hypothetical protein